MNIAREDFCIGRSFAALDSGDNCISYLFGVMVNLKQRFDRRNVDGTKVGSITKDDLQSLKVVKPANEILEQYHAIEDPACLSKTEYDGIGEPETLGAQGLVIANVYERASEGGFQQTIVISD